MASLPGAAVAGRGEPPGAATAVVAHPPAVQLTHPPDKVRQASLLTDSWYLVPWWYRRFRPRPAQTFFVPVHKLEYLLSLSRDLAKGPYRVPACVVTRLKGLIPSSWVAVGNATRVRTRKMDCVIESLPPALSCSRLDLCRSWNASVELSPACREEIP